MIIDADKAYNDFMADKMRIIVDYGLKNNYDVYALEEAIAIGLGQEFVEKHRNLIKIGQRLIDSAIASGIDMMATCTRISQIELLIHHAWVEKKLNFISQNN